MEELTLIEKLQAFISEKKLFRDDEQILLAVSGGMDSVVMAELFHLCTFKFGVAHCNFQLREKESEADENFVEALASKYGVSFFSKRFDTKAYQKKHKMSTEEAARTLRYAWFEEIRTSFQYAYIATAHHLNDSIETVLLNFTKGTGIRGLQGIQAKNKKIIRPLLFATRKELHEYCEANTLEYRTDSTNYSDDFQRNKIRNRVIPVLKEINPSLENTFSKTAQHLAHTNIIFAEAITKKIKKLVQYRNDAVYIPIRALKKQSTASTILFEILRHYHFTVSQSLEIYENLFGSGKQFYSSTHKVIIDRVFLIITGLKTETSPHIIIEKEHKTVHTKNFTLHFEYSNYKPGMQFNTSGAIAYFDAEKISFPLILRIWKKGDYMYPIGLYKKSSTEKTKKPAKKKISDLLTDAKVDLHEKENTFVLLEGEKICWLPNHRQDERYRLSPSARKLLKIKMLPVTKSIS